MKRLTKISIGINVFKIVKWIVNRKRRRPQEVITMKETKSELYVTSIASLVAIVMNIMGVLQPDLMIKVMAVLGSVYTVGRTLVKMTRTTLDDRAIEELGKLLEKHKA